MDSYLPIVRMHDIHMRLKMLNSNNEKIQSSVRQRKDSYCKLEEDLWQAIKLSIEEHNKAVRNA